MSTKKIIGPFAQLISLEDLPVKGALSEKDLKIYDQAGILIENNLIKKVGDFETLKQKYASDKVLIITLQMEAVVLPGFIDAHTHLCFVGSRARDYALRNAGSTYQEIAKSGGGIWDTVLKTRQASQEELTHIVVKNTNRLLRKGITTVEVKSGYGLSIAEELKILRAIQQASYITETEIVSTCLAAHIPPKESEMSSVEYLELLSLQLLPKVKQENLSKRVDIFIEENAFTASEAIPYLKNAEDLGFDITIHADQFSSSGSKLGVEMNALSVDHLESSTEEDIERIAKSNTIAIALPGASLGLGCGFTPARKILDKGGGLAIASDWNPGSAPMGDLLTQACILGAFEKLSNAEVLAGITFRAALALGLKDRGKLTEGTVADFVVFPVKDHKEIWYRQGALQPAQVWKNGDIVYKSQNG